MEVSTELPLRAAAQGRGRAKTLADRPAAGLFLHSPELGVPPLTVKGASRLLLRKQCREVRRGAV